MNELDLNCDKKSESGIKSDLRVDLALDRTPAKMRK